MDAGRSPHQALCFAVFALLATGFVLGQQRAPADYRSVAEAVLAAIDLAKEIDSGPHRPAERPRHCQRADLHGLFRNKPHNVA